VGHLTADDLRLMKKAGCRRISFGVESGSLRVLKIMKKDITPEMTIKTLQDCYRAGIKTSVFILVGIPGEKEKDLELTFNLLRKTWFWGICFMIYHPYPKTELFEYCIQNHLFNAPKTLQEWSDYDVYDWGNTLPNKYRSKIERFRDREIPMILAKNQIQYYLFKDPREALKTIFSKQVLRKIKSLLSSFYKE
jgi:hypothetical protein